MQDQTNAEHRPLQSFVVPRKDWEDYRSSTGYSKTIKHIDLFYFGRRLDRRTHKGELPVERPNRLTVRVVHPLPVEDTE